MVLSNCQFILIVKQNQFGFLASKHFKYTERHRKKNKKIFKSLFQKKASIFNFYTTWIFDAHTTGYYDFKKKIACKIPFELKYISNTTIFYKKKYFLGKFDSKWGCFLFFSIKCMLVNRLYKSKLFEKKISSNNCNWYFNQNIIQNINKNIDFVYIFKLSDSKLSTMFVDGNFFLKTYHVVLFSLYKNLIPIKHRTSNLILHIQFLEFLSLYIKLFKNFRTKYNFNYFFEFKFNVNLSKMLIYCFFFTSFFSTRISKFALSHEIIFHSKKKFNLIKFLLDKNFQINKQQKNVNFINFINFLSIKVNKICIKQLESIYIKYKKNVYTHVYSYNSMLIFQKKPIERITGKIWNLKLRFSESLLENFLKQFKKKNKIYLRQQYVFKYAKLAILLYIKVDIFDKGDFFKKFCLILFYLTCNFYFYVKLCFNFISWTNINVNLNELKLFSSKRKIKRHERYRGIMYRDLVLKKYFKYKY